MRRLALLIMLSSSVTVACGGVGNDDATEAAGKSDPTPRPAHSDAAVLEVVIRPVGDQMKYETTEFTVTAGSHVRLVMENVATLAAMHHNVVITRPGTNTDEVGVAAIQAGDTGGYIPEHEAILFHTPMARPGETSEVEFVAPDAGDYPYLCTFPGHYALMKGVMHSVERK